MVRVRRANRRNNVFFIGLRVPDQIAAVILPTCKQK
jgi:hypothetical protein